MERLLLQNSRFILRRNLMRKVCQSCCHGKPITSTVFIPVVFALLTILFFFASFLDASQGVGAVEPDYKYHVGFLKLVWSW